LVPPLFDDTKYVVFAQDEMFFAIELNFRSGIFAEENPVSCFNIQSNDFAILLFPGPDRDDLALLGLFFRCVRDNQATTGLLFLGKPLHNNAIVQRANLSRHKIALLKIKR
jgi:hypothetical protein